MSLDSLRCDLRCAVRQIRRERTFAATALVMLAIGIGASTAVFALVQAVLLRPIGMTDPSRVVMLWPSDTRDGTVGELSFSAANEMRERLRTFADVAVVGSVNWSGTIALPDGRPLGLSASAVSATFFDVLQARPLLGRTFRAEDDAPSAPRVLVLSHAVWTAHFGADPAVVGRVVRVKEEGDAESFEIIGVMPQEFFFPDNAGYWTPAGRRLASIARDAGLELEPLLETLLVFHGIGRLAADTAHGRARAETELYLRTRAETAGTDPATAKMMLTPVLDHVFGPARPALAVLMGAVLVVLLIACSNVAGLLFARGVLRGREMAMRAALGASRSVLVQHMLVESSMIAIVGGLLGVAAAYASLQGLVALSPVDVARLHEAAIDTRVLTAALMLAFVTSVVFGLGPAWHFSRPSLVNDLKGAANGVVSGASAGLPRRALIAAQVAATLALLTAAGLCIQSFARLVTLDLGFEPQNVLTFNILGLDGSRYPTRAQRHDAIEQLLARFERVPQVSAAGGVFQRPFEHGPVGMDARFLLEGQADTIDMRQGNPLLNHEAVSGSYFSAMGIRLLRGRLFEQADRQGAQPVAIISEAMAARVWPGQDPLGKRLRLVGGDDAEWKTVVGVVGTARYREIETPRLDIYVPLRQAENDVQHFMVRTTTDPLTHVAPLAKEIATLDAGLSIGRVSTMEEIVSRVRAPWRFTMQVFTAFGLIAVALTAVGLFGLVSHEVNQRTREIGIRVAFGARSRNVVWLAVRQAASPTAIGLGLGLMASIVGMRALSSLLFEIRPTDPATFSAVLLLLAIVALVASYLPARRAASVDPQVVLRDG